MIKNNDMNTTSNRERHLQLVSLYAFSSAFNSMSLQTKAGYDLGYIKIYISSYDKKLDALSDEELEEKINSIKKPEWYDKYEYIKKRNKQLLQVLYFIPSTAVVDKLYNGLKLNKKVNFTAKETLRLIFSVFIQRGINVNSIQLLYKILKSKNTQ